jgi:Protein of unknown function (DUF2905)
VDFDTALLGRVLLGLGIVVAVVGALLALGVRLPFGRLPGDLSGGSGNVSYAVPLGTCLVVSVVLTIVLNLIVRR